MTVMIPANTNSVWDKLILIAFMNRYGLAVGSFFDKAVEVLTKWMLLKTPNAKELHVLLVREFRDVIVAADENRVRISTPSILEMNRSLPATEALANPPTYLSVRVA